MNKSLLKLMLPLLLLTVGIYSCNDDDDEPPLLDPVITDIDPEQGPVGTPVTITGANFGADPIVRFGDEEATLSDVSTTSITTEVPSGLPAGALQVTVNNDGSVSDGVTFTVTEDTDGDGDPDSPVLIANIADTVATIDSLSSLNTALGAADGDLVDLLNGDGRFTLFAPVNGAFDSLVSSLDLADLDEIVGALGTDVLQELLLAHVVEDSLPADLIEAQEYTTANDSTITITTDADGNVFANGAQVIQPNIIAGNGVIHIIDSVINVPIREDDDNEIEGTVSDSIAATDMLSTLTLALEAAGLADDLEGEGPFTVFAPNDDAFSDLLAALELNDLDEVVAELGEDGLADLLLAHVVADSLAADMLMAQDYPTLNPNQTLTVTMEGDSVFVNGAGVLRADILATNGVIHVIDSVVNLPDVGVEEVGVGSAIAENATLDSLEVALTLADLVDTLNDQSAEYTVFAPDNQAFVNALTGAGVTNVEELVAALESEATGSARSLLLGHIVTGSISLGELEDGQTLTALNGETLTVTIDESGASINGSAVTASDNVVDNGIVHTINSIIMPAE